MAINFKVLLPKIAVVGNKTWFKLKGAGNTWGCNGFENVEGLPLATDFAGFLS